MPFIITDDVASLQRQKLTYRGLMLRHEIPVPRKANEHTSSASVTSSLPDL